MCPCHCLLSSPIPCQQQQRAPSGPGHLVDQDLWWTCHAYSWMGPQNMVDGPIVGWRNAQQLLGPWRWMIQEWFVEWVSKRDGFSRWDPKRTTGISDVRTKRTSVTTAIILETSMSSTCITTRSLLSHGDVNICNVDLVYPLVNKRSWLDNGNL